jgi:nicotinate dehydrogenase subunit A
MIRLIVNGESREVAAEPTALLVEVLRNDLELTGTKYGCGQGQCGVCTVIVGGRAMRSCQVTAQAVAGQELTTIEGVGSPENPHPLQVAVSEAQAFQCGHCAAGLIMDAKALLDRTARPTEAQVRQVLEGHECMCGSRGQVIRAVLRVAGAAGRP